MNASEFIKQLQDLIAEHGDHFLVDESNEPLTVVFDKGIESHLAPAFVVSPE